MKPSVMVIDDPASARQLVKGALSPTCTVFDFASVAEALAALDRASFDCVVTDLRMPGLDGLDGLRRFLARRPDLAVIVVTAFGTAEPAVEAKRAGAFEYLRKPFDPEELELVVARAVAHSSLRRENRRLRSELAGSFSVQGLVGRSQVMRDLVAILERVAPTDVPVLIEGEGGTGKDLVARALHGMSKRRGGPFIALNMSAIPESLAESELFGHEKGAFTGADSARAGFFAEAEKNTLLLDEIGRLPPALQAKLLRLLQDGEYIPVGGRRARRAGARVLCATNEDLRRRVEEGRFREDLYYRIRVVPLRLPPLRERREDLPLLCEHLLRKHALLLERPPLQPSPEALRALLQHAWPGNVRELEHALERALLLARGDVITPADLPPEIKAWHETDQEGGYRKARDAWERRYFQELLDGVNGSVARAAELAGLHRSTLYEKLARVGLVQGEGEGGRRG